MYAEDVIGKLRRIHKEGLLSNFKINQNKQTSDKPSASPPFLLPS
jgi:hypothetical protein